MTAPLPTSAPLALIVTLCAIFVAIGGGVAALGPSLPGLATTISRPLPDLGMLLSAVFTGMLVSQASAGALVNRYGTRPVAITAFVLYGVGAGSIPWVGALPSLLGGGLTMGLGFGLSSISVNLLASALVPTRPGFILNLCNVWYAAGTVAGPFLGSLFLARGRPAATTLLVASAGVLCLIPLAWSLIPAPPAVTARLAEAATAGRAPAWRPSPALLSIGVMVLLYGGIEAGFGGWLASYAQLTLAVTPVRAALLTSLFWFSYLLGRITATWATLYFRPGQILAATTVITAAGGAVLGVGHGDQGLAIVAIVLLGFGVGPVYPSMFALVTARFTARPASAVSVAASLGSVGAVVLPWVMGQTLPLAGGRVVSWTPAALAVGMLLSLWLSQRWHQRAARTPGLGR